MDDGGDLSHADCYTECGDYRDIPFRQWEVDDVCAWLESLKISPRTVDSFRAAHIEGGLLQFLSDKVLCDDLCVYLQTERDKIVQNVKRLLAEERQNIQDQVKSGSSTSAATASATSNPNSWANSGRSADSKWYIGQTQARFVRKRKWAGPGLFLAAILFLILVAYFVVTLEEISTAGLYIAVLFVIILSLCSCCTYLRFNILPEEVIIRRTGIDDDEPFQILLDSLSSIHMIIILAWYSQIRVRGLKIWSLQPRTWAQDQIHYVTLETTPETRYEFVKGKYQRVQVAVYVTFKEADQPGRLCSCFRNQITRLKLPLRHDDETYAIEAAQRIAFLLSVPYLLKPPNESERIRSQSTLRSYSSLNEDLEENWLA